MRKIAALTVAVLLICLSSFAQEKEKVFTAGGYTSWLHNVIFDTVTNVWINSSMLHNRLNFNAYAGNKVTFNLEIRNRLIMGDMILLDPAYRESIEYDPGWADLSWNIIDEASVIFNMMIDRAYIDFSSGRFQIRTGRQRINWSQSLVWNPNDIFNIYSYFDFDYIERPGSDAIRIVFSPGPSSAAEVAVKANSSGKVTAAALYRFSVLNTDLQFLAGETDEEMFNAGTGWSGAIASYSVRGEATWFHPFDNSGLKDNVIVTAGVDRIFSDKFNAMIQLMYSSNPSEPDNFRELYRGGITASGLAFSEFTAMCQASYSPMPLVSISLSGIWYPDLKGYYAGPGLDFSLAENVDFSFVWQYFSSVISGDKSQVNLGFIRIKYSF